MSTTKDVTDATFQAEVVDSGETVLVDFWAAWCGPCRAVSPILDQIAAENSDKIRVVKVNVDENQATAAAHRIGSIPTLMVYRDGVPQKTIVGALPKRALESELQEFLAG
ncbi:thioredoxin [Streptomyces tendae]|uniref:thioredoxin n=1 Tax=Streptomyces tendae TaxID=1932 RepID=UPI003D73FED1